MRLLTNKWLLAVIIASTPFLTQAQESQTSKPELSEKQQQLLTELKQLQVAFGQTQQAIKTLEEKTMTQTPALKKKRMALESLIDRKMNADGYNAQAEAKALRDIVQKYEESGKTPSDAEVTDFQKRQMVLQKKQQMVMQDKEVQEMMNTFNAELLKEAKKIDPNTDALLMRMQDQIKQIQALRLQLQQSVAK